MIYSQINREFLFWAQSIGAEFESLASADKVTLLIRTVEESETHLTGEIFYAVPIYTDKLHIFIFSEVTIWEKDNHGNTKEPVSEQFEVISAT